MTTFQQLKRRKSIVSEIFDTEALPKIDYDKNKKTDEDIQMIIRMTKRSNRKSYILYPEDKLKNSWDLVMTIILLITCIETPYDIAFADNTISFNLFTTIIDLIFLFDIIVIFNSAFYTEEMDIVEDRK